VHDQLNSAINSNRIAYRSDIDGLRAIAVLSVVVFHLSPGRARGGFVGVDIFFVISGFLISSIIYDEFESRSFSTVDFYTRRIRRIFPALFLVLSAVALAGWLFLAPTDFVQLGKQILGGSAFVGNFVVWQQSGYFSADAESKPLLHLWSLGVEEQYYLIFPLICVLFYRAKNRWALPLAFLTIGVASFAINLACVVRYSTATYFLPFSRLWELFIGAGLALALHRDWPFGWKSRLTPVGRSILSFVGLALLAFAIFRIDPSDPFPGWRALLPTVGAALLIAAGQESWINRHILSFKPAVLIGLISYPLYLWHWPILCFVHSAEKLRGLDRSHGFRVDVIAASFVLACLTYRFVEVPVRRIKSPEKRRTGAMWLLGSVAGAGVFGLMVIVSGGFPSRSPSAIVALDHNYKADADVAFRAGTCFLQKEQTASAFANDCLDPAGEDKTQPLVLLWGDSHAADLFPGFEALKDETGVRLAQFTTAQCAPILGIQMHGRPNCPSTNDAVMERVRALKPDVVVLSASWDTYNVNQDRDVADKFQRTIESIRAAGVKRTVVIGSSPFWVTPVPSLLISAAYRNLKQPVPHRLQRTMLRPHDDSLVISTTRNAKAVFVPIFDDLCDASTCLVTTGSTWQDVVVFDTNHFTEHGSILVARQIWPSILERSRLVAKSGK
jgi:peptidoglycan/LPS O-acetylase OafA/YrhL